MGPAPASHTPSASVGTTASMGPTSPIDIISAAPTPMLTTEASSPQSSSLPSTDVSTVDGPTTAAAGAKLEAGAVEVRIEGL